MSSSSPLLIGVTGGSSSGKKSVCEQIIASLPKTVRPRVGILSMESFYEYREKEMEKLDYRRKVAAGEWNFDHPRAFDFQRMEITLRKLLRRDADVQIPEYDLKTHSMLPTGTNSNPWSQLDIIIIEGIYVLYKHSIRDLLAVKIFVDVDSDIRLSRRVIRDTQEFDRPVEKVLAEYVRYVKPAFEEFIFPTKKYADIILPRGPENKVAIQLIVEHIQDVLDGKTPGFKVPDYNAVQSDILMGESDYEVTAQGTVVFEESEHHHHHHHPSHSQVRDRSQSDTSFKAIVS